jgi:hypothetical protein
MDLFDLLNRQSQEFRRQKWGCFALIIFLGLPFIGAISRIFGGGVFSWAVWLLLSGAALWGWHRHYKS